MKKFQSRWSGVVVLGLSLLSAQAGAWGDLGHETVGEIAETHLTPEAKAMVLAILGVEPLAVAATFPDHVRDDERFAAFAPYHFVEFVDGTTYRPGTMAKDANAILSKAPQLIVSASTPRQAKSTLLRYIVHLVGDVHQPLHVGNDLDRGANLCEVIWEDPETGHRSHTNLHTVWDGKIIGKIQSDYTKAHSKPGKHLYFTYKHLAEDVLTNARLSDEDKSRLEVIDPLVWYTEAKALHPVVYPDLHPVTDGRLRPYCDYHEPETPDVVVHKKKAAKDIPVLNAGYVERSIPVIRRQLLKGGYRLAAFLNDMAKHYDFSQESTPTEQSLLKTITIDGRQ